jgi:hypothetical protein
VQEQKTEQEKKRMVSLIDTKQEEGEVQDNDEPNLQFG